MIKRIPISQLEPHPENSNYMDADSLKKLRRHIESTGRYEPLTVRPHPSEEGKFQVVNGHHRLRVLRAIGHKEADCAVWNIDDNHARLYLATLNRLRGTDIPERRAVLIENLLKCFDADQLSGLLPDDKRQIEEIQRLASIQLDDLEELASPGKEKMKPNIILDFMVIEDDAKVINLALDLVIESAQDDVSRSHALVHLARHYIKCSSRTADTLAAAK